MLLGNCSCLYRDLVDVVNGRTVIEDKDQTSLMLLNVLIRAKPIMWGEWYSNAEMLLTSVSRTNPSNARSFFVPDQKDGVSERIGSARLHLADGLTLASWQRVRDMAWLLPVSLPRLVNAIIFDNIYRSVRLSMGRLIVNVDISTAVMYASSLIPMLC